MIKSAEKSASNRDQNHKLCGTRKIMGKEDDDIW